MKYSTLKDHYESKNVKCEKDLGRIYSLRNNSLYYVGCGKWDCARCRPRLKYNLYLDLLRYIYIYDLYYHFVITFSGNKLRQQYSYDESFVYMNKAWDKYKLVIEYRYGKMSYIVLPRSQRNGYCHYHILTNIFPSIGFLEEKRKKYSLGFNRIKENKNVAEYLQQDYFKDHEYIIPKNIRHYRSSRNIKLLNYKKDSFWNEDNVYYSKYASFKFIDLDVNERFGRPLPLVEYLKEYI